MQVFKRHQLRNTSTDVEKTLRIPIWVLSMRKHLHGRGEDLSIRRTSLFILETPPRTLRRRFVHHEVIRVGGNTSTDVEKTSSAEMSTSLREKHLHGRGEDRSIQCAESIWQKHLHGRGEDRTGIRADRGLPETPPRTWRRPKAHIKDLDPSRKHLHGRGEDFADWHFRRLFRETPPRTWRRLAVNGDAIRDDRKHLHGRGEDKTCFSKVLNFPETPPRTWRRPANRMRMRAHCRNTSTDVEKTHAQVA